MVNKYGSMVLQVHGECHYKLLPDLDESMVSLVSRRYMRVVNGSLLVCLSEYLPLHTVYILVIKLKVCFAKILVKWHCGLSCLFE